MKCVNCTVMNLGEICPNFDLAEKICNLGKPVEYDAKDRCWRPKEGCIMFAQEDETDTKEINYDPK